MNKFVLIPYDQFNSFKSYLMEKKHDTSSKNKESEVIADTDKIENTDKNVMDDEINISMKSEGENLNKNDLTGDILDEKKEKTTDNDNDHRTGDRFLPPPGIPVKIKKTEKIFQYGNRDRQEGAGTKKTEPKWIKNWQRKIK